MEIKDFNEWKQIRSSYIGGSDAGAVIGINPYKKAGKEQMTVKQQVVECVKQLGYNGDIEICTKALGSVIVWADGKRIGVYSIAGGRFVTE